MDGVNIFHKNVDNPVLRRYHNAMNRKGMSLIEIIVSLVVLSVAALAVVAAVSLVNSEKMRARGGSTLELQALGYARQTLELLKNNVNSQEAAGQPGEPLVDYSYVRPCATAADTTCDPAGVGTRWGQPLPAGELLNHGGIRRYTVWDISDGLGGVAYRKVTVTVDGWTD